jgi:hypothetical protein
MSKNMCVFNQPVQRHPSAVSRYVIGRAHHKIPELAEYENFGAFRPCLGSVQSLPISLTSVILIFIFQIHLFIYLFTAIGFPPDGSGRQTCTEIGNRQHKGETITKQYKNTK